MGQIEGIVRWVRQRVSEMGQIEGIVIWVRQRVSEMGQVEGQWDGLGNIQASYEGTKCLSRKMLSDLQQPRQMVFNSVVHCTMYNVHCTSGTLYNVQCTSGTLYIVYSVHLIQCTSCTVYILYIVHLVQCTSSTVYILYSVHPVHCTMYISVHHVQCA